MTMTLIERSKRPMRVAVTGAYGYSGQYMARYLLAQGHDVITLTNSSHRSNPFADRVKAFPFNFSNPAALEKNTPWRRRSDQ
jgi:nucleoside-diphosphate-sugar epimerase